MSKRVAANVPLISFRRLRDQNRYNPSPMPGQPVQADRYAAIVGQESLPHKGQTVACAPRIYL
jgi:hypothetical protein